MVLWLTLLTLSAVVTAYYAIINLPQILNESPGTPVWALWVKVGLSVFNVGFLAAIWLWKRWALVGLAVSTGAVFLINVYVGFPWSEAIVGVSGFVILLVLLLPGRLWRQFR